MANQIHLVELANEKLGKSREEDQTQEAHQSSYDLLQNLCQNQKDQKEFP